MAFVGLPSLHKEGLMPGAFLHSTHPASLAHPDRADPWLHWACSEHFVPECGVGSSRIRLHVKNSKQILLMALDGILVWIKTNCQDIQRPIQEIWTWSECLDELNVFQNGKIEVTSWRKQFPEEKPLA